MRSLPATQTLRITPAGTFRGSRATGLLLTAVMLALMPIGLVTSTIGWTVATVLILVAGQVLDYFSLLRAPGPHGVLLRGGFDLNARTLVRLASVAVAATVAGPAWSAAAVWAAWLLWYAAGAAEHLARIGISRRRGLTGRGLPELDDLPEPPQTMSAWPFAALLAIAAVVHPVAGALAIASAATLRAMVSAKDLLDEHRNQIRRRRRVNEALLAYRPEVILLGGGKVRQMHQVNIWLPVLDRLGRKALVILQSTSGKPALTPSTTPVLCVEDQADLLRLGLDSARLALYSADMDPVRLPHVRHAFIGHSENEEFATAYDEIWVAGQAGQDRYAEAGVRLPGEAFVHVGRPQLDTVTRLPHQRSGTPTVLYAPAWEGRTAEAYHASLLQVGVPLIHAIQRDHPDIRILLRPHPMTGTRDRAAAATLAEVRALLPAADVMLPGAVDIQDSLAAADLLICDLPSVLSDYLATGRPYCVPSSFAANPAAAAAYPLGRELRGLEAALDAARKAARGEPDDLAPERNRLRDYILGPDRPQVAFEQAVERSVDERLNAVR
jgi:hypothetical protein